MDQSTSVPTSASEQNLTPGEQRILAVMEQGQQRIEQRFERIEKRFERIEKRMDSMEQRMESMEKKLDSQGQQLEDLTIKVDHEIGASKMRDRQLAIDLQGVREEIQHRDILLKAHVDNLENNLRKDFGERFSQLDTRLGAVELLVQQSRRA
jgi:predicted  nucleic acid-binding Zn-ribbon protein